MVFCIQADSGKGIVLDSVNSPELLVAQKDVQPAFSGIWDMVEGW